MYRVHENEVRHNRDAYVCFYIRQGSAEQQERSRLSNSVVPSDEMGPGASAEVFQMSPPRGDGSTPGDPREDGCSWGSTPPTPQPAPTDVRNADVVGDPFVAEMSQHSSAGVSAPGGGKRRGVISDLSEAVGRDATILVDDGPEHRVNFGR